MDVRAQARSRVLVVCAVSIALGAASCGKAPCGPGNCTGCCDSAGACQADLATCGTAGGAGGGAGGGSGSHYGFMTGTLAFTVQGAGAYFKMTSDGGADLSRGVIFMADQPIGCPPARGPVLADARLLGLDGTGVTSGGARTYQVAELPSSAVFMAQAFADAGTRMYETGNTGSFAFTSMSLGTGISGTFDVSLLGDGGLTSLSGNFAAPFCGLY